MAVRNAASMGTYGATWQTKGYAGQGNVIDLIDSLKGRTAIIAGNGFTVFHDIAKAEHLLKEPPIYFAVNDIGIYLPKLDHWVSHHYDKLKTWRDCRWLESRPGEDVKLHSIDEQAYIHYVWQQLTPMFALSGYLAMQIAYIMGADLIVLCGCPGMQQRRFFEWTPKTYGYGGGISGADNSVREQLIEEMNRLPEFKAKVRSMGGWTRAFFGPLIPGRG